MAIDFSKYGTPIQEDSGNSMSEYGTPATPVRPNRTKINEDLVAAQKEAAVPTSTRFLRELPGQITKAVLQTPSKFAVSALMAPGDIVKGLRGEAPSSVNIPGIGQTFQGEASNRFDQLYGKAYEGKLGKYEQLKGLAPFAEVPLAGIETAGLAKGLIGDVGLTKGSSLAPGEVKKGIIPNYLQERSQKKLLDNALEITKPTLDKKESIGAIERAGMPGGATEKYKVAPTSRDIEVAKSVQGLVENNKTPIKNATNINKAIENISETKVKPLLEMADKNNPLAPISGKTPGWSPLVQKIADVEKPAFLKADPILDRTYELVRKKMIDEIMKQPPTRVGLWEARKSFDRIAQDQLGSLNDMSEKASVIRQAVLDTRRVVNSYISDITPSNDATFGQLMNQLSNMYEARRNIAESAYKMLGKSALKRFIMQNPKKWKALKYTLEGAVGLGGVYGVGKIVD